MHGVLLRWNRWSIEPEPARASLVAELDWSRHRDLQRVFPFDFMLRLSYRLVEVGAGGAALEVATEVISRGTPVPLSFGWHPYLALPAPRSKCRLRSPALSAVALDDGLPRRTTSHGSARGSLVTRAPFVLDADALRRGLDELFAGVSDGASISIESVDPRMSATNPARSLRASVRRQPMARRVAIEFVRGYRFVQLYSPRGADFICIEPMMAPTAALSDAASELPMLGPGQRASAIFRIVVSQA